MKIVSNEELSYLQSLPLEQKVMIAKDRIRSFVRFYGTDGVYVSFSGGVDSTVLLHIVRSIYPDVRALFLDTWMEWPQIRAFVSEFPSVDTKKPCMGMKEIIKNYGWCFPSKDVAEAIWAARKGQKWAINKLRGLDKDGKPNKYREQYKKWLPLYESKFIISPYCCDEQKEKPAYEYEEETGRHPIIGTMASESARRKETYLRTGCNTFDTTIAYDAYTGEEIRRNNNRPMSRPISIFSKQDILQYIIKNHLKYAAPYGKILEADQVEGQCAFDFCPCGKLKCTGESRTGCMFCPVGCHLDGLAKFERLKAYNRKVYEYVMEELGEKDLIEWIRKNYVAKG